jgi:hypothetical protein
MGIFLVAAAIISTSISSSAAKLEDGADKLLLLVLALEFGDVLLGADVEELLLVARLGLGDDNAEDAGGITAGDFVTFFPCATDGGEDALGLVPAFLPTGFLASNALPVATVLLRIVSRGVWDFFSSVSSSIGISPRFFFPSEGNSFEYKSSSGVLIILSLRSSGGSSEEDFRGRTYDDEGHGVASVGFSSGTQLVAFSFPFADICRVITFFSPVADNSGAIFEREGEGEPPLPSIFEREGESAPDSRPLYAITFASGGLVGWSETVCF